MVRTLNEAFDDETYEKLLEVKGWRSWDQAIIEEFGIEDDEDDEEGGDDGA